MSYDKAPHEHPMKLRVGRPNHADLAMPTQFHPNGRLPSPVRTKQYGQGTMLVERGTQFDPNPSPKVEMRPGVWISRGYAMGANPPWRVNYGPAEHLEQLRLAMELKSIGKDHSFVTDLYPEEAKDFQKFLAEKDLEWNVKTGDVLPIKKINVVSVSVDMAGTDTPKRKPGRKPKVTVKEEQKDMAIS